MNSIAEWLDAWGAMIRARDIDAARRLFAEDVIAFRSLSEAMIGRDELERNQWEPIWNRTRGFRFEDHTVVFDNSREAVVAATWSSEGEGEAGRLYPRRGRATLAFRRENGDLVCIHSHFSMNPGSSALES
jgi:ketosteroid isomerase-like protein